MAGGGNATHEKKMTKQRRTAFAVSGLALLAFAHLATGCNGVLENNLSGLGSGSECIAIRTGGWEFDLSTGGQTFFSFVGGDLTQSGCFLTYDGDQIFQGDLRGSIWNVSSAASGFNIIGSFSGNPATTFSGTFIDVNNNPASMSGRYVGR